MLAATLGLAGGGAGMGRMYPPSAATAGAGSAGGSAGAGSASGAAALVDAVNARSLPPFYFLFRVLANQDTCGFESHVHQSLSKVP